MNLVQHFSSSDILISGPPLARLVYPSHMWAVDATRLSRKSQSIVFGRFSSICTPNYSSFTGRDRASPASPCKVSWLLCNVPAKAGCKDVEFLSSYMFNKYACQCLSPILLQHMGQLSCRFHIYTTVFLWQIFSQIHNITLPNIKHISMFFEFAEL